MTPVEMFARHLDLSPLRGRLKGNTRCIFHHPDRTPSLSVDLRRGFFHCFGCGVKGGLERFAELVGEPLKGGRPARPRRMPSPLDAARAAIIREARGQPWMRPGVVEGYHRADWLKSRERLIDQGRQRVTGLGDCEPAWELAAMCAELEREVWALEADPDDPIWAALLPTLTPTTANPRVVEVL